MGNFNLSCMRSLDRVRESAPFISIQPDGLAGGLHA
jgi:hypothetical protein